MFGFLRSSKKTISNILHLYNTSSLRKLLQLLIHCCLLEGITLSILVRRWEILLELMGWNEHKKVHSASNISDSLQDLLHHRSDTQGEVTEATVGHYNYMEEPGAGKRLKNHNWYCLHWAIVSIQNSYTIWETSTHCMSLNRHDSTDDKLVSFTQDPPHV